MPVSHFFRKKRHRNGSIFWESYGLCSSALITGCISGPKPRPCLCIWEDVWSLSWCAGTCKTRLSLVFSSLFSIFSLCLMAQHLCWLRVHVLLTRYPRNSTPQVLVWSSCCFESLSRSFLLFSVKSMTVVIAQAYSKSPPERQLYSEIMSIEIWDRFSPFGCLMWDTLLIITTLFAW